MWQRGEDKNESVMEKTMMERVCEREREPCCRVVLPVNVRRLSSVLTAKKSVVNQGNSSAKEVINKHVIFIWCVLVCVCVAVYVCASTPLDLFCFQTA